MFRKMIRVALVVTFVALSATFVSTALAQSPAPARSAAGPAGTPVGDTPIPPFRVYLPLMLRLSGDAPLPSDLSITWVYANMRGFNGGCIPQYEPLMFKVCVRNLGAGDAGPFSISIDNAFGARSTGLAAGESECLETVNAAYGSSPVTAEVDSQNEVVESNESNNTWTGMIPLPTPPILCTPAPTATPTTTPMP